jgi:hypothetical protein
MDHRERGRQVELAEDNVVRYCILIGYMTARFWNMTANPRRGPWEKATHNLSGYAGPMPSRRSSLRS